MVETMNGLQLDSVAGNASASAYPRISARARALEALGGTRRFETSVWKCRVAATQEELVKAQLRVEG